MPNRIASRFSLLLSGLFMTGILLPLPALALEITPYELDFRVSPGQEQTRAITISNDSDEEASYRINADEGYSEWFTFTPDRVTLGPQQSREVTVTLRPPRTSVGKHDTFIYITPQPSGSGAPVVLGMKLRVSIDITVRSTGSMSDTAWLIIVIAAGIIALVFLFFAVIRPLVRRY